MKVLTEEQILKILKEQNIWWDSGEINQFLTKEYKRNEFDKVLKIFLNPIRRFPVLSGARRVGKSTIMFQIIEHLLKNGVNPRQIFFYTLDELPMNDITIQTALDVYKKYVYANNDYYLFIDEAQNDKNWKNNLKIIYDLYPDVHALISGSASAALEISSNDSGSGRFISVKIPTLSFFEYCKFKGIEVDLEEVDVFKMHELPLIEQTRIIDKIGKLNLEMINYFKLGGFPEFVGSDDYTYTTFLIRDQIIGKAIRQDIPRVTNIKDINSLTNVFIYLCFTTSQILNVDAVSKELQIDRSTLNSYIDALEKANLIYICEQLNLGGKKPLKSRRKIHISDIAIRNAITRNSDFLTNETDYGNAIESSVFKHTKDMFDSIDNIYNVGYVRGENGKEIDIVVQENTHDIQYIEAKNRNVSKIKDSDGIIVYGLEDVPGYVVTKNIDDFGLTKRKNTKLYRIPAVVYLYLTGKMKK